MRAASMSAERLRASERPPALRALERAVLRSTSLPLPCHQTAFPGSYPHLIGSLRETSRQASNQTTQTGPARFALLGRLERGEVRRNMTWELRALISADSPGPAEKLWRRRKQARWCAARERASASRAGVPG